MRLCFPLVALFVLITVQAGVAQEIDNHKLTVRGRAHVSAKADRAKIQFDVRGVGNSLNAAFDNARSKLDQLAQKLYAIGLEKKNLSTSFFKNERNFGDKAFLSSKRDYQAIMTVSVTIDKIDLMEQIVVAISESGIEQIQDFSFDLINYGQLRKDAIVKATEAAKEKGKLVANSLGVQLGDVLEFEEMEPTKIPPSGSKTLVPRYLVSPFNTYISSQSGDQSGVFSDDIDFEIEVRVVFALLAPGAGIPSDEGK